MPAMHPLSKPLRTRLEATVKAAREVAETAARNALEHLGVGESSAPAHLTEEQRELRRRLRLHGRQLGDVKHKDERQDIRHLVWEVAYEHWHRMLFARFLAENNMLMHPDGVAISLADCDELAMDEGATDGWDLAGRYAARMLPQVFRNDAPALQLRLAPEHQRELAKLVSGLDVDTFRASDSLGWVYQFWQSKRKDEVNASEVKIGADELPAVTQLFTEPYMVEFILHNSLGAWWETRHPSEPCPMQLTYLRNLDDGTPAAGKFEGWPDTLKDFKLLDPCCGSGHFIVAAFHLLVPMRIQAEGLGAAEAVDAVIADNLHGLEIDPRCVEIAAFALALAAWSYPDAGGYRVLPALNIACCGLKVSARANDWAALVPDDASHATLLRQDLRLLHASMREAPLLGSLLDPWRSLRDDLATSDYAGLQALLSTALAQERASLLSDSEDLWDAAVSALGLLDAARILAQQYHQVITNVPYRAGLDLQEALYAYIEKNFPAGKTNLASAFLLRCIELTTLHGGVVNLVLPQDWLVQPTYESLRRDLIRDTCIDYIVRLGPGAFQEITGEVVNVLLLGATNKAPHPEHAYLALDCGRQKGYAAKQAAISAEKFSAITQSNVSRNPGFSIFLGQQAEGTSFLGQHASSVQGIKSGDDERLTKKFWEIASHGPRWMPLQGTVARTQPFGGLERVIDWTGNGSLLARKQGLKAWGKMGVAISQMSSLPCTIYAGGAFDSNVTVILPRGTADVVALMNFALSGELSRLVREFDHSIKPTNSSFEKVIFSKQQWQSGGPFLEVKDFPKPHSDDPTQWIFHGHPKPAPDPLQVAIARLLGYHWPAETDADMELSDEARAWIAESAKLSAFADDDGVACLPSVRGEKPAAERLLDLLIAAWGADWQQGTLDKLLDQVDCVGKGLDYWLRERFFEQHCKRFHHRPFIWHVWDGLKDGFAALVNYHKLTRRNLETLIYTYLGDWIRTQERAARDGVDGADLRLAAAQTLKTKLEKILEGEAPYDIFVRWKPLDQQPIGWDPDLNDGVRLNIRPFMTAEVLRHNKKPKLNITWGKDRGKDVESAPWFKVFKGERINDYHLTLAEKRAPRGKI